jgi:hypothetical protein
MNVTNECYQMLHTIVGMVRTYLVSMDMSPPPAVGAIFFHASEHSLPI